MSPDSSPSVYEVLKQLIGGIKNQLLLFALATIIVLALLGTSIPSTYIVLIYVVVIFALIVAALPAIKAALRRPEQGGTARSSTERSGGVDMQGDNTRVEGDVVGRDKIIVMPAAAPDKSVPAPLSEAEQLKVYLDKVMADNNVLRLGGISSEASDPQRRLAEAKNPGTLSEVFISLKIDRYRGEPEEQARRGKSDPREIDVAGDVMGREREQLTALEALSADNAAHAVLLGLPGAGKSSVLRYLSYRLAEAYLRPQQLKETLPEWQSGVLLPVFLSLAKLADALPDQAQKGLDAKVRQFVEEEVEAAEESKASVRACGARRASGACCSCLTAWTKCPRTNARW